MNSAPGLLFSARTRWLQHMLSIAACLFFAAPFAWMLVTSLKVDSQVFQWPPVLVPDPLTIGNYVVALVTARFARYMLNTLLLSIAVVLGNLLSSALVGYGFSRVQWKGRDVAFIIMISTMLLPEVITLVPLYVVFRRLGIVGNGYLSYLPLILPYWFGKPYYVFLMRQFFLGVPRDLSQAARIDGCNELGILGRVVLPLAKPALIAVTLFTLLDTWRDFLAPLIYISSRDLFTISIGLAEFQGRYVTRWNQVMAASVLTVVPILVIFIVAQKRFVQGISLTGLK
jgi:multiple sugar transport system permease protein